jgi:hypothetical protein
MAETSPSLSLNKAPEDLEQNAVDDTVDAVEDAAQGTAEQGLEKIKDDYLDDTLMFPLDIIVLGLQNAIPQIVSSAKAKLDSFISSLPCSAILHLVLIETMTIWIFFYSVVTVFTDVTKAASIQKNAPTDGLVPAPAQVDACLTEYASRIVWGGAHMSDGDCYDQATVEGPYEEGVDDTGLAWIMQYIIYGCLLLCMTLWLVVLGYFCFHTSCRVWVRYQSGTYLKASFITRRSLPYRFTCGLLGICGVLSIGVTVFICFMLEILGWFLSSQLLPLFVVLASARSFLAPTKPKFDYNELHQLTFKRSTFFQTNGGFAVKLSDALIQSARGSQFRGPLKKLLAREKDWALALRICFVAKSGSGNTALLKLWGVAKDHLPTALSAVQEHGPNVVKHI